MREEPIAYEASVHEEVLRIGAGRGGLRQAGKPGEHQYPAACFHGDASIGKCFTQQRRGALGRGLRPQMAADAAVVLEREGDLRPCQGDARECLVAMAELGGLAAQELTARRCVEVELGHLDRRTGGARGRLGLGGACAFGADHAAMRRPARAGGERQARHRGDRGERLAAEAHGGDRLEVFEAADLAGGVPREGERQVLARDALAVVLDLDAPRAAFVEGHRDRPCPGVEAVLEQFLQHRGGPLHDLARRYLAHEQLG